MKIITFLTSAFASDSSISFLLVATIVAADDILEPASVEGMELTTIGEEAIVIE